MTTIAATLDETNESVRGIGDRAFVLFPAFALASTVAGAFAVHSLFGVAVCTVAGLCAAIPVVIGIQTVLVARHLRESSRRRTAATTHGQPEAGFERRVP